MIISNLRRIVGGTGEGKILVTIQPINFLAMVNAYTGTITDPLQGLKARVEADARRVVIMEFS
jgi:predicted aconitase with swiveling domain